MLLPSEQNQDTSILHDAPTATSDVIPKEMKATPEQKGTSAPAQDWISTLRSPIPISERPSMEEIVRIVRIVRAFGHE